MTPNGDAIPETVRGIAEAVRTGRATAVDVVRRTFDRVRERDDEVKAFLSLREEAALTEAEELDRRADRAALRLAGVPVAVKDNEDVAGVPTSLGSEVGPDAPAVRDVAVVARLRAAGAVVVGKTSLPELSLWASTDGHWGVTRNPRSLDRTPGGSSGGSAAAVAAGMVPLAVGNDGLGSVRIPAACCGIAGVMFGRGVAPAEMRGGNWYALAVNGPLARTVDDVALAAAVMADMPALELRPGAPADAPRRAFKIAVSLENPLPGGRLDPEWEAATMEAADRLRAAGHRLIEVDPPYSVTDALPVFARWLAGTADALDRLDAEVDRRRLQRRTRTHAGLGRWVRRLGGPRERPRRKVVRRLGGFLDRYDALITPALSAPPIAADPWARRGWLANVLANTGYAPYQAAWNLVGAPAGAVPAGTHSDGTPLAVQVVASHGRDARVLRVMAAIEEAFSRR